MYKELTQKLLGAKSPEKIQLRASPFKMMPNSDDLKDSRINPCLVRKRTANSLLLPREIRDSAEIVRFRNKGNSVADFYSNIE
jgi:hypothetical protein